MTCSVRPMVSVSIITYNHENYIAQCLESALSQRVSFDYEIIIGDDCSTDQTREILRAYAQRYPERIRLVLHHENTGQYQMARDMRPYYRGKYIAVLGGDDYWINPLKMQRQVDFLEANPSYSGVCGDFQIVDQNGNQIKGPPVDRIYCKKQCFTLEDAQRYLMPSQISTWLYHNFLLEMTETQWEAYGACRANGDSALTLILTLKGNFFYSDEKESCWRVHQNGWTELAKKNNIDCFEYCAMQELTKFAQDAFGIKVDYSNAMLHAWFGTVVWFLKHPSAVNWKSLMRVFQSGNDQATKLLFLVSNTASWPVRFIKRRTYL